MSTLGGEHGLDDLLAVGHGFVTDPAAVFGLGGDVLADPPSWLAAPEQVRRRLAAKPPDDGVHPRHWPGVVELARWCADVAEDVSDDGAAPAAAVHRALTLSTALSRQLPKPPIALVDVGAFPPPTGDLIEAALTGGGPGAGDWDEPAGVAVGLGLSPSYLLGYWQDRLRAQACRLADCIDDPQWTDPDALAGLVDDTRRILAAYFVTVLELDARPVPPPRRPVPHVRRHSRRQRRPGTTGPGVGHHVSHRPLPP